MGKRTIGERSVESLNRFDWHEILSIFPMSWIISLQTISCRFRLGKHHACAYHRATFGNRLATAKLTPTRQSCEYASKPRLKKHWRNKFPEIASIAAAFAALFETRRRPFFSASFAARHD
jgi:hypothetical protein